YTELGTGLHYLKDGQWLESREEIKIVPGGAIAEEGQHKAEFAVNINSVPAVILTTPDGQRLQTRVFGLSYYDSDTDESALIAELQNSVGQLLPPNQIIYTN